MADIHQLVEEINMLKQQGLDNNQIINTLKKKGHTHTEIFDAMNQTQLGGTNTMMPNNNNQMNTPPQMPMPPQQNQSNQQTQNIDPGMMSSTNEELIETMIEEKWNELIKDINKIINWKNRTEEKIIKIEQQFKDMKNQFDELHKAIIGKIGEYDKNILNVGAEVKAMEKVFSNVLPVFVNNVKELNDISKRFKVVASNSKKRSTTSKR
jgi:hypothetical protein